MKRCLSPSAGRTTLLASSGLLLALFVSACAQGSSASTNSSSAGELLELPEEIAEQYGDGFDYYVGAKHKGGAAPALTIEQVLWGRLVDVYAEEGPGQPRTKVLRDLLIDPSLESDPQDYRLQLNPVTLRTELTIRFPFGSEEFEDLLQPLLEGAGLQPVLPKGVSPGELPPFTAVGRNAAIAIVFDDLIDPDSVTRENVKLQVGYPPEAPFESRIVPDRSRGAVVGGEFLSNSVVVDLTVSKFEAQALGISVNTLGLPGAANALQANVALRIPTKADPSAAQFSVLQNPTGHPLAFVGNGPADPGSPTLDVVRGLRSGGPTSITQDPYEGFLPDRIPPRLLGAQRVTLQLSDQQPPEPELFRVDLGFTVATCAVPPRAGDLLEVGNGVMRVVVDSGPLVGGSAQDVLVERADDQFGEDEPPLAGVADLKFPWDPAQGLLPECFVRFAPTPLSPPAQGVSTSATIRLSFSEPMNPERTEAFDGIQLVDPSVPGTLPLSRTVVGVVAPSPELTNHTFQPSLPLKHVAGQSETYEVVLVSEYDPFQDVTVGVTDLAGNAVEDLLPPVSFSIADSEETLDTGGISLRFNSIDENEDGNPEIRGQLVPDYSRGVIRPRGMVRFSGFADTTNQSNPVVLAMTPIGGVIEPLSIYGSRTMTVWRYHDLNLPFYDDQYFNIDVEGLAWMVAGTGVQLDLFPEFQLRVSHSRYLPDEVIGQDAMGNPVLLYPNSGLVTTFASNLLEPTQDPQVILAPKGNGYPIQPLDSFKTPSGTLMQPFPVNLGKPVSQYTYWTWRDTSILALGGPNSGGVDTGVNPPTEQDGFYGPGQVPTIGLPLLMDFRTYPAPTTAQGSNSLFLAAVNTAGPNAGLPFFRIHSTGGVLATGQRKLVNPDQELTAQGGLDAAGNATQPIDSGFYYGNADFVARVNRIHTIWLDTGSPSSYSPLVSIPRTTEIPAGTQMSFAFRGATQVTGLANAQNGENIDPYGNRRPQGTNFTVNYLNSDPGWKETLAELDGARYVQVRVTMITSAETGAAPELDAIGIAYFR
jgi:hypothetical protein